MEAPLPLFSDIATNLSQEIYKFNQTTETKKCANLQIFQDIKFFHSQVSYTYRHVIQKLKHLD